MTSARQIVSEEWGRIVEEFELRPGSVAEKLVARIINRLDEETNNKLADEIDAAYSKALNGNAEAELRNLLRDRVIDILAGLRSRPVPPKGVRQ